MDSRLRWQCHAFAEFTPLGLYRMLQLRDQVFVLEQQSLYGDVDGLDPEALHVCGNDEHGCLQAYARLLAPGVKYPDAVAVGRVVIAAAHRGRGRGRELMLRVLDEAARHYPGVAQKLSAQCTAMAFYQSLGFVTCSDVYDDGGIDHVDMWRDGDISTPNARCGGGAVAATPSNRG
ncbi:GNAT family N-acetyltransferase [Paludibacterium yongneupense]|uniref:GNAT family N-acetyltransferase n=1 Tax=Paludibacterium yongneupense TaxID=400061 RepID=UPI00040D0175|nr:GNAT family N-acetyltransferase [Paludibacterium yongneupense]